MSATALFDIPTSIPKEELDKAIQQAMGLEIATIPTYLYTYYSIKRSWGQTPYPNTGGSISKADQKVIDGKQRPVKLSSAEGLRQYIKKYNVVGLSDSQVQEMAITFQVFSNKAAAYIMSVVIEEMLHTGLISNIKQAMFGHPNMVDKIPTFPTVLPGHVPEFTINQAKFSLEQLITFLKIESPEAFQQRSRDAAPIEYKTIGQFYEMIENCIAENYSDTAFYNSQRPQLVPRKGIYTANSINTVHYDRNHNPHFPSEEESGDLLHITNLQSALKAMEIIVEQGEGHSGGSVLNEYGEPDCQKWSGTSEKDKDAPGEFSHFAKFLQLYCEGKELMAKIDEAFKGVFDGDEPAFYRFFVYDIPENPRIANGGEHPDYSNNEIVQTMVTLTQQIYTYTFLMLETCYYYGGKTQYEIFMFGMHKSMIWIVSEFCNMIRKWDYTSANGDTYNVGAVFRPYAFASTSSPKAQMVELCRKMVELAGKNPEYGTAKSFEWLEEYIQTLPNVSLEHTVDPQNLMKTVPKKVTTGAS
jgi:hypothetical protein